MRKNLKVIAHTNHSVNQNVWVASCMHAYIIQLPITVDKLTYLLIDRCKYIGHYIVCYCTFLYPHIQWYIATPTLWYIHNCDLLSEWGWIDKFSVVCGKGRERSCQCQKTCSLKHDLYAKCIINYLILLYDKICSFKTYFLSGSQYTSSPCVADRKKKRKTCKWTCSQIKL